MVSAWTILRTLSSEVLMNTRSRDPLFLTSLAVAALLVTGCGDDPLGPSDAETVVVSPATAELTALQETVQLTAEAQDSGGRAIAGLAITWTSLTPSVVTVDAQGVARAVAPGTAQVRAEVEGGTASGTASITVNQVATQVQVAGVPDSLLAGETVQLSAQAQDANGFDLVDPNFTWSSQDPAVATVDGQGRVAGRDTGEATIMASVTGTSGSAAITVVRRFFTPNEDETLSGEVKVRELNIPAGVTITASEDLVLDVQGAGEVAGTLRGDCMSIEVRSSGDFTLDGSIENLCSGNPAETPGGVKLVVDGELTIGTTASAQPAILSDGSVDIRDSSTEDLELDPVELDPVAPGGSSGPAPGSESTRAAGSPATQPQAGAARVQRPVRAGRGGDVRIARAATIEIWGLVEAGDGADAPALVQDGECDNSNAFGGKGGSIFLSATEDPGTLVIRATAELRAGNGGAGGDCTAPSGSPAVATGGTGGNGGGVYVGGVTVTFEGNPTITRGNGGRGGDALAFGDDGAEPCEAGSEAFATGGPGGDRGGVGWVILEPGSINGQATEAGGNGGEGGLARADGGDGADCDECPLGAGGDGGNATATGGQGGDGAPAGAWPAGAGAHQQGQGGNATAFGGFGGDGADCCVPVPEAGGDGGRGGDAHAVGGAFGVRGQGGGGAPGRAEAFGGHGGNGGPGLPPGLGGAGGGATAQSALPAPGGLATQNGFVEEDGEDGNDGGPCPGDKSGTYAVSIGVLSDPGGHAPFIGLQEVPEVEVTVETTASGTTVVVAGPGPWVSVSGEMNPQTGEFVANGTGTVAGFPNVSVQMRGILRCDDTLEAEYEMGLQGELPGGDSTIYGVSGERKDASSGSPRPMEQRTPAGPESQ